MPCMGIFRFRKIRYTRIFRSKFALHGQISRFKQNFRPNGGKISLSDGFLTTTLAPLEEQGPREGDLYGFLEVVRVKF